MKIVVPFPPGGGGDICGRIAAHAIGTRFGHTVFVENRAGAGGSVGAELVMRAPADGYTLLLASSETHSLYPHVYPKHRFRASEFVGVTPVARAEFLLVGRPGLEARTLTDLAALAKRRQLTYSTWGTGSSAHLNMFALARKLGVPEFLHVPYLGAGPAVMAVVSGEVDVAITAMPLAKAQDKLVRLGVLSPMRSRHMPDLPTLREQNIDLVSELWLGLLAPPNTPASVVESLARGYVPALSSSAIQQTIVESGQEPFTLQPAAFQKYLVAESEKWAGVTREANVRLE